MNLSDLEVVHMLPEGLGSMGDAERGYTLRAHALKLAWIANHAGNSKAVLFSAAVPITADMAKVCDDASHLYAWLEKGALIPPMVGLTFPSGSVEMKMSQENIDILTGHAPDGGNPPEWNDRPLKKRVYEPAEGAELSPEVPFRSGVDEHGITSMPLLGTPMATRNSRTFREVTNDAIEEIKRRDDDRRQQDPYTPTDLTKGA